LNRKLLGILMLAGVVLASTGFAVSAFAAQNSGGTTPGWGFGDTNHVHTGPPGQSVRP
jgi:hypothetical protein